MITRQQTSVGRVDKSILDYVIVSEELCNQLEEMIIHDEVFNNHGNIIHDISKIILIWMT